MFAAARPRTIAPPSARAAASARRASRASARVHARANDGDVNVDRREFVRNAAFVALSATLVAPREVRRRAMRAIDDDASDARATGDAREAARAVGTAGTPYRDGERRTASARRDDGTRDATEARGRRRAIRPTDSRAIRMTDDDGAGAWTLAGARRFLRRG